MGKMKELFMEEQQAAGIDLHHQLMRDADYQYQCYLELLKERTKVKKDSKIS